MHPASLVRLDSLPLPLGKEGALPSRLKLLAWGKNPSSKGTWICNETTARELPGNQKRANFDRVALDFNHNTVPGSDTYRGEPAQVAAYGTPNLIANDGLYIEGLEWTEAGREFVGGRHYIDLSPTILPNEKGEVLFLHSAAACRQGAITGLSLLGADVPAIATLLQTLTPNSMTDYKPLVLSLLGLSADTADTAITTAAQKFATDQKAQKTRIAGLLKLSADATDAEIETAATEFAKKAEPKAELETLTSTLKTLTTEIAALKLNSAKAEIEGIKNAAAAEGKVIPAEILAGPVGGDPAQLRALAASLPQTVPLEQRTSGTPQKSTSALVTNSAEDEVRKTLGISKESWEKHNSAK